MLLRYVTTYWRRAATTRLLPQYSGSYHRKELRTRSCDIRSTTLLKAGLFFASECCQGVAMEEETSPDSSCASHQPLEADPNVTAVAGEVRTLSGQPLEGVSLRIADEATRTDDTGRLSS